MLSGEDYVLNKDSYPEGLAVSAHADNMWLLNALMEEKRYSEALPFAEALHKHYTDHPLPMFLAGVCQFNMKNWTDAKDWFDMSYIHCKEYASIPLHLGVIEARKRNYREALGHLKYSLLLDDAPSITHYQIGRVLHADGCVDEAISFYQKAAKINPHHLGYKESLAIALKQKG
jgi:tetratricopeptide (TPR) repeat protein